MHSLINVNYSERMCDGYLLCFFFVFSPPCPRGQIDIFSNCEYKLHCLKGLIAIHFQECDETHLKLYTKNKKLQLSMAVKEKCGFPELGPIITLLD